MLGNCQKAQKKDPFVCLCTQVRVPRSSNYMLRLHQTKPVLLWDGRNWWRDSEVPRFHIEKPCLISKRQKHFHQLLIEMTGYGPLLFVCSPHKQSGKSYWKSNLFTNMSNCFLFWSYGSSRAHKIIYLEPDLIFVRNITNYISGENLSSKHLKGQFWPCVSDEKCL